MRIKPNRIVFAFFIVFFCHGCKQHLNTTNNQGRIVNYPNGKLKLECYYKSNKFDSICKEYDTTSVLIKTIEYSDNRWDSIVTLYYQNKKSVELFFVHGGLEDIKVLNNSYYNNKYYHNSGLGEIGMAMFEVHCTNCHLEDAVAFKRDRVFSKYTYQSLYSYLLSDIHPKSKGRFVFDTKNIDTIKVQAIYDYLHVIEGETIP